ncbi:MAG: CYTH domain-containing protein [Chitinophagaceae bacterium]
MALEIERKYLVQHNKWNAIEKPTGHRIRQGYILTDPEKTIRVRLKDDKGFLTIKGLTAGATRAEYEYEIPAKDAEELLDKFSESELAKVRYNISFGNKTWEVDVFTGDNDGLIVAEIELQSEDEQFALPGWIDKEVTGEAKYYNANLTITPYKLWNP